VSWLRHAVRALAIALAALAALVLTLVAHGYSVANGSEPRRLLPLRVRPDPALIERGRHLAEIGCAGCHSPASSLPLAGGVTNFLDLPGGPRLGRLYAPNLTPGGRLPRYDDAELGRAIREGLDLERRPFLVMPSNAWRGLSDRDLAALIAWLRSQPASGSPTPPRRIGPLAYLILGTHAFETSRQRPVDRPVPDVPERADVAYGEYLTGILGCANCHGATFRGGRDPFAPRGPDLVAVVTRHPVEGFGRALREGRGADGRTLDPARMPWVPWRRLTDLEVRAVYEYLRKQASAPRPGTEME